MVNYDVQNQEQNFSVQYICGELNTISTWTSQMTRWRRDFRGMNEGTTEVILPIAHQY